MNTKPWTWPDSLDALAAAPESHRSLLEDETVRVLETRIVPSEVTRVHTHRWQASSTSSRSAILCDGMATAPSWSTRARAARFQNRAQRSGASLYLRTLSRTSTR